MHVPNNKMDNLFCYSSLVRRCLPDSLFYHQIAPAVKNAELRLCSSVSNSHFPLQSAVKWVLSSQIVLGIQRRLSTGGQATSGTRRRQCHPSHLNRAAISLVLFIGGFHRRGRCGRRKKCGRSHDCRPDENAENSLARANLPKRPCLFRHHLTQ